MTYKVEVRDLGNAKRLLGHLLNPPTVPSRIERGGAPLRMAVLPKLSALSYNVDGNLPAIETDIRSVELHLDWRHEDGGYTKRGYFKTDAPLEDLLLVRDFVLPGEDGGQAYRRRTYSR